MGLRIDELYAFVAEDTEGEGLTGFRNPQTGEWMPMVAADAARVESLRDMARSIAIFSKKPVRLVRFSVREEVEVFQP